MPDPSAHPQAPPDPLFVELAATLIRYQGSDPNSSAAHAFSCLLALLASVAESVRTQYGPEEHALFVARCVAEVSRFGHILATSVPLPGDVPTDGRPEPPLSALRDLKGKQKGRLR